MSNVILVSGEAGVIPSGGTKPVHYAFDTDECFLMHRSGVPCPDCHERSVFHYTPKNCVVECPVCGEIDLSDSLPFDPNAMVKAPRRRAGIESSANRSPFVTLEFGSGVDA